MARKRMSKKGGRSISSTAKTVAKEAAKIAKANRVLSGALSNAGLKIPANIARAVGLGKKRRKRRTSKRGGSFVGKYLGKLTSIPAAAIIGSTAGVQGAIKGLGKTGGMRFRHTPRMYRGRPIGYF